MPAPSIIHSGFRAYVAGLKLSDNPFKRGSAASSFWSEGYTKARRAETAAKHETSRERKSIARNGQSLSRANGQ